MESTYTYDQIEDMLSDEIFAEDFYLSLMVLVQRIDLRANEIVAHVTSTSDSYKNVINHLSSTLSDGDTVTVRSITEVRSTKVLDNVKCD